MAGSELVVSIKDTGSPPQAKEASREVEVLRVCGNKATLYNVIQGKVRSINNFYMVLIIFCNKKHQY